MALENSVFTSRPDSLSLPVEERGEGEEVEVATEVTASSGVFNLSEELGHVVTTETAPSPPPSAKVNRSFQAKLAEREAKANQTSRKKTQGTEKERGRFGWGEWFCILLPVLDGLFNDDMNVNGSQDIITDSINSSRDLGAVDWLQSVDQHHHSPGFTQTNTHCV